MADEAQDSASKTEEATPRKLEEARKKGDVAKSHDVASWMALAAVCGVMMSMGGRLSHNLAEGLSVFLSAPHEMIEALESGHGAEVGAKAAMIGAPVVGAIMLAAAVAGVFGNVMQTGLLWTTSKLAPDLNKVSPLSGFKRIYGVDGLAQFVKTLLKLAITGWVAWRVLEPHREEMAQAATLAPQAILPLAKTLLVALLSSALTFLGVTAGADWLWQRQRFLVRMRMSREELKEDMKQTEGDPHIKGRLRQIRMMRARKRMMANVPKATLVVTNPTHYAVALRYVAGETPAPICVAKGMDAVALKIREVAGEHEIPIVEDPPLARALYGTVEIDDVIPREHYEAVAKVIGFIMTAKALRRRRPAAQQARRPL
jgi:flagellar biosynthetic protein FlhB